MRLTTPVIAAISAGSFTVIVFVSVTILYFSGFFTETDKDTTMDKGSKGIATGKVTDENAKDIATGKDTKVTDENVKGDATNKDTKVIDEVPKGDATNKDTKATDENVKGDETNKDTKVTGDNAKKDTKATDEDPKGKATNKDTKGTDEDPKGKPTDKNNNADKPQNIDDSLIKAVDDVKTYLGSDDKICKILKTSFVNGEEDKQLLRTWLDKTFEKIDAKDVLDSILQAFLLSCKRALEKVKACSGADKKALNEATDSLHYLSYYVEKVFVKLAPQYGISHEFGAKVTPSKLMKSCESDPEKKRMAIILLEIRKCDCEYFSKLNQCTDASKRAENEREIKQIDSILKAL